LKLQFDSAQPTGGILQAATACCYDGWNVIEERDVYNSTPTNRVSRRYTWGTDVSGTHQDAGGVGGLLMAEQINGSTITPHYYHYDGNGDVIALTNASGTREARYRYTAFGGNAFTEAALLSFGAVQLYPCQKSVSANDQNRTKKGLPIRTREDILPTWQTLIGSPSGAKSRVALWFFLREHPPDRR